MRMLPLAAACALCPLQILAQEANTESGSQRSRANFLFARMAQEAQQSSATILLPRAAEVLRSDGAREARKEQNYWAIIRHQEAVRLGVIYRAQTERALQAIRNKIDAGRKVASVNNRRIERTSAASGAAEQKVPPENTVQVAGPPLAVATPVTAARAPRIGDAVQSAANRIAETIEETFYPQQSASQPPSSAVILALIAIFVAPGIAGVLVVLAFLSLRGGHRLQSAVFAVPALAIALVVYAAVFHQQTLPGEERLRAECAQLAITVTASVQELASDGAVLADFRSTGSGTAVTDRNGCAFLFTAKPEFLPNGRRFTCVVYPAGSREVRNVSGLDAEMPAYTDSLDAAVAFRQKEVVEGNWWRRFFGPLAKG